MSFRQRYPVAWTFHRNTGRWPHNLLPLPGEGPGVGPFKEYPGAPAIPLPPPRLPTVPLAGAMAARHSCRRWAATPLTPEELGTLLAAAYAVTGRMEGGGGELLERPVPSGGGLYPLEWYVLARSVEGLAPGVYHYASLSHALERVREVPLPVPFLAHLFLGQPYAAAAQAQLVVTGVVERSFFKYGDRGYRYMLLEAGHAAQNLALAAAGAGLGALSLGGFFDDSLAALLDLDTDVEVPLYALSAGHPEPGDRDTLRSVPEGW